MFKKLVISSLAVILVLIAGSVWATDYYVATTGSDVTGDGSAGNPWQTIQHAINNVGSGDVIHVAAGTYNETLNIVSKNNLTIQGADKATTIVKSSTLLDWNVGSYGSTRKTVVRVVTSTNIDISGFTFDFDLIKGNNISGVLYWDATGELSNNNFKNMSLPDASAYYEITSYVRAPSYTASARAQVTFSNNTFSETGRLGIVSHDYVNLIVSGNTFYKTVDDFGYAMEIGSASIATISGNTIYGYDTPAASDGSSSAGIYVENCYTGSLSGLTKTVSITDNEIYDCQYALHIGNEFNGYAGDVDIVVNASNNNIHNNDEGGIVIADEDKAAGSSVTANFQSNTVANNGDYGYFIYTYGDGDITVNATQDDITGHNVGVHLEDAATGTSSSSYDINFNQCNIQNNTTYGVENLYSGTMIDAKNNWWGNASGPYDNKTLPGTPNYNNPSGTGNAVTSYVDYQPWSDVLIPVELTSFTARAADGVVVLEWVTQSETENFGYHVYRNMSAEGDYTRITNQIIRGAGSSAEAHTYSYTDRDVQSGKTYYYKLCDVDYNGNQSFHGPISVSVDASLISKSIEGIPTEYSLGQNYPNPFNPETTINFSLKESGYVSLKVYNIVGQVVRTLVSGEKAAGVYSLMWNGTDDAGVRLMSGVYYYTLQVNGFSDTKKLVLMK